MFVFVFTPRRDSNKLLATIGITFIVSFAMILFSLPIVIYLSIIVCGNINNDGDGESDGDSDDISKLKIMIDTS